MHFPLGYLLLEKDNYQLKVLHLFETGIWDIFLLGKEKSESGVALVRQSIVLVLCIYVEAVKQLLICAKH